MPFSSEKVPYPMIPNGRERTIRIWLFAWTTILFLSGSSLVSGQTGEKGGVSVAARAPEGSERAQESFREPAQDVKKKNSPPQAPKPGEYPESATAESTGIPYPRPASSFLEAKQSLSVTSEREPAQGENSFQSFTGLGGSIPLFAPLADSWTGPGYQPILPRQATPYWLMLAAAPETVAQEEARAVARRVLKRKPRGGAAAARWLTRLQASLGKRPPRGARCGSHPT